MTLKQIEKLFNNLKGNETIGDQLKMYGGKKIVCIDYPFILPDQGKMKRVYWK